MRGLFIAGTDTDAGKTTVVAALLRALLGAGVPALAVKPVQTGCQELGGEERGCEERGEEGTLLKKGFPPPPTPPSSFPRLSVNGEAALHEGALPEGEEGMGEGRGAAYGGGGKDSLSCASGRDAAVCPQSATCSERGERGREKGREAGRMFPLSSEAPFKSSDARPSSLLAPDAACYEAAGGAGIVLETFRPACSPHLAARLAGRALTVGGLLGKLREAAPEDAFLLVEGAGGLYVPLNERETMLDFMEGLGFPVLLVVGNRLGCINHALLSLDVLRSRGLRAAGMVLDRTAPETDCDPGSGPHADSGNERRLLRDNAETLRALGEERGVPLLAEIPYGPDVASDPGRAWPRLAALLDPVVSALRPLLAASLSPSVRAPSWNAASPFTESPGKEEGAGEGGKPSGEGKPFSPIADPASLLAFDRRHLWHPYASALNPLPVREAVSAAGVRIRLRDGRELVDGMSSWWCAIHGYGHPALVEALQRQAGTMAHVMFGGLTHGPAVELGRRLLSILPKNLRHIFYADSGSVSIEVALKMAVQYWASRGRPQKTRFLVPRGGYHGDTQGAMSVCDPVNGMHGLFRSVLPEHVFVERPRCRFDAPFDPESLRPLREALERDAGSIAAVVLEPVVQGAGGMWFYHPDYLRGLRKLCDGHEALLVVDEIATGFGRTGKLFASEWADLEPDILCLGKALTGGVMTLAAAVAGERVARGIEEAGPERGGGVFMHGPTFMGNPLACAVACASVDLLLASPWEERVEGIRRGLAQGLAPCRDFRGVRDVRTLGAIGVVEVDKPVNMARLQDFFVSRGVWVRPFDRNIYLMPPYCIEPEDLKRLTDAVVEAVRGDYS